MVIEEGVEMEPREIDFVETTTIGEVHWRLNRFPSRGVGVLFLSCRELLTEVARLFCDGSRRNLAARQYRLEFLVEHGLIRLSGVSPDAFKWPGVVDLELLPADLSCEVIFLPEVYIVYAPSLGKSKQPASEIASPQAIPTL
jgi:hypothetical protein